MGGLYATSNDTFDHLMIRNHFAGAEELAAIFDHLNLALSTRKSSRDRHHLSTFH